MDNFASGMDEQYGKKQDVLVEGFLMILQSILMDKRDQWEQEQDAGAGRKKDFYKSHPAKKWNETEEARIQSGDITTWDTSLCSKWLREFKWTSTQKLNHVEAIAIANLAGIRNEAKHAAKSGHVTREQFEKNCELCETSLLALKTDPDLIKDILVNARNACVVDRKQLVQLLQTPWDHKTIDILGTGAFGVVISVENPIDQSVSAIKLIPIKDWDDNLDHKALREARNLYRLSNFHHRNVVTYKAGGRFKLTPQKLRAILKWDSSIYKDKELQKSDSLELMMLQQSPLITGLYIITEVCAETLRDWLRVDHVYDPEGKDAIQICLGLIQGISYIHQQGVIHRDFRPDNVFFAKTEFQLPIKIGDFGLSIHHAEVVNYTITRTSPVGHHLYQAPEMKKPAEKGKDDHKMSVRYGKSVDLFSLGLTISEIFDPEVEVEHKFNTIKYQFNTGEKITKNWPHIHELILRLTSHNPSARGSLDDQKQEVWWHRGIPVAGGRTSAETVDNMNRNFEHLAISQPLNTANITPPPRPRGSPSSSATPLQILSEDDIVTMRKLCLRERGFWTPDNIRQFLDLVEPDKTHNVGLDSVKKDFNSNMYRIVRDGGRRNPATKYNLTAAVTRLGYPDLAEKFDKLSFTAQR